MKKSYLTRRQLIKAGLAGGASLMLPWKFNLSKALADAQIPGLSDPAMQPKFAIDAPNALAPSFKYYPVGYRKGRFLYDVAARQIQHNTGLVDPSGNPVATTVWGYAPPLRGATWPGRTFEVWKNQPIAVRWRNKLIEGGQPLPHLLPVDTNLHWSYALHGYEGYSIEDDGVPIVSHLHGGHTRSQADGNPEYFFSPNFRVKGPRWETKWYKYDNDQPAGNLWYHDHALGITRLNVWAGLAGFYFIRDDEDAGHLLNPLGLPAYPYELAYAIQDRMFTSSGELFYSAFPGDPLYDDFITDEGAELPPELFPDGGPTALAEFFGDHMVVNGVIWPKTDVEPRNYRMHLLNGTDSRFMVVRFRAVAPGATDLTNAGAPIPFYVIGSDQGLASAAQSTDTLVFEPGSRYDVVFDFSDPALAGQRVIMENIGGDAPFGGYYGDDLDADDLFSNRQTDRIMAFDVVKPLTRWIPDRFDPAAIGHYEGNSAPVDRTRKVALFEGMDEFGRLQPLLGTAEPATDYKGNPVTYRMGAQAGQQINGSVAWHEATTENPALGSTEIWEIYNATGDAHPVHLHLVNFEVLDRQEFTADVIQQPVVQHNGAEGVGFRLENIVKGALVALGSEYVENAPKDMVTALPDQVTRIKMTFDKPGRYVWHCHILSHEDHEMMRVLHVGQGA